MLLSRSAPLRVLMLVAAMLLGSGAVTGCKMLPEKWQHKKEARVSGPEAMYTRAQEDLHSQDFNAGIRSLEALLARYPFTPQARQARLDLIYAYYRAHESESAQDAAETFIRENPTHPRIDYAWYLKGLNDFERVPNSLERWMGVDMTQRPPTGARDAFTALRTVVQRYPTSLYAHDARRRMVYLRNRLADFEINVAHHYEERGAWVAAAQRARQTIEQYDGAPAVKEALRVLVRSYHKLD